ncbi:hypothetical protein D3C76_657530 [compost metagenome]
MNGSQGLGIGSVYLSRLRTLSRISAFKEGPGRSVNRFDPIALKETDPERTGYRFEIRDFAIREAQ